VNVSYIGAYQGNRAVSHCERRSPEGTIANPHTVNVPRQADGWTSEHGYVRTLCGHSLRGLRALTVCKPGPELAFGSQLAMARFDSHGPLPGHSRLPISFLPAHQQHTMLRPRYVRYFTRPRGRMQQPSIANCFPGRRSSFSPKLLGQVWINKSRGRSSMARCVCRIRC
jgi:hypothetical protein